MKNCNENYYKLRSFVNNNKLVIVFVVIAVFLTWGYEMSNFALTIDEEANWNRSGMQCFRSRITDGRFFLGILKLFFPRVFLPFWSTAVFAIGMVLSGCLLVFVFQKHFQNTLSKIAAACVFVSFPVHAFYVMFSIMSAEAALCYFMTIYAVYLVDQGLQKEKLNLKHLFAPAIMIILVNGVYQAFFTVYIILVCALIALDLFAEKDSENMSKIVTLYWKRIFGHVVFLVTSAIGYAVVVKILQWLIAPSRHYIEGYIEWGKYSFIETIKVFIKTIWRISWSTGNDQSYVTMWVVSALFVVLFFVGILRCPRKLKFLFFLSMCGMFLSNYLMMFVAGNTIPVRLYVTLPIFAAVILAMFIENVAKENTQTIFGIFLAVIILIQSANVTDLFWAENRQKDNDRVKMTRMTSEIAELAGTWIPEEPVIIFSDISYANYEGTFGFSYFSMADRIYGYLDTYGFDYYKGNKEQRAYATERVESMPTFPEEGSIVKEKGIIIVNLK